MTIRIDSNFAGGGVENIRINGNTVDFSAPLDGSERSLWFYFRIKGAGGRKLTFKQRNMNRVLGVLESRTYQLVRPVVREGKHGKWYRLSEGDIDFSIDPLQFSFYLEPLSDETYVAFCYPYQYQDLLNFIGSYNKDFLELKIIGKSKEERDFPLLMIGSKEQEERKKLIVVIARQHAGEVSASYFLEGLISKLNNSRILKKAAIAIFPFVDIDGVESGRYGKGRPPVDFNRDWTAKPWHIEIELIQTYIEKLAVDYQYTLFVDLHAPQPGGLSYLLSARKSFLADLEQRKNYLRFVRDYEKAVEDIGRCRIIDHDPDSLNWSTSLYKNTASSYQSFVHGVNTIGHEISYHFDGNNNLLTPDKWRNMGERFIDLIFDHYIYKKQLKKVNSVKDTSKEILWKNWEMVNLPLNMDIKEDDNNGLKLKPLNKNNRAWLTYRPIIKINSFKKDDLKLDLSLNHFEKGNKFQAKIYLYYFAGRKVLMVSKPFYLEIDEKRYQWVVEIDRQLKATGVQISIHVVDIKQNLKITVL